MRREHVEPSLVDFLDGLMQDRQSQDKEPDRDDQMEKYLPPIEHRTPCD